MKIARHGFDPGIRYPNQRLLEVAVSKANRLEHGARWRTVAPVSNATAAVFEVHKQKDYDTEGSNGNNQKRLELQKLPIDFSPPRVYAIAARAESPEVTADVGG